MKLIAFFFIVALFVVLTPGVFVTLPKKGGNKWTVALVHGVIFAIVWFIFYKPLTHINYSFILEGAEVKEKEKNIAEKIASAIPSVPGL